MPLYAMKPSEQNSPDQRRQGEYGKAVDPRKPVGAFNGKRDTGHAGHAQNPNPTSRAVGPGSFARPKQSGPQNDSHPGKCGVGDDHWVPLVHPNRLSIHRHFVNLPRRGNAPTSAGRAGVGINVREHETDPNMGMGLAVGALDALKAIDELL